MSQRLFVFFIAILCAMPVFAPAQQQQSQTARVVSAANAYLASLSDAQRQSTMFAFDDLTQQARWSNFPTGVVPRSGVNFKQMTAPQREAAMNLLAAVLSPMGLEKVNQIRQADDDFKTNGSKRGGPRGGAGGGNGFRGGGGPPPDGPNGPGGPGGGGRPQFGGGPGGPGGGGGPRGRPGGGDLFGSDLYYFSFLGKPSATEPWMLQFGGHHLALNITIAGSKGVLTPSLTGAQPASFTLDGKTIRPIGRESDKALALVQALDDKQRKQAVLTYRVPDLVLGPGQDDKKITPEGLKASAMTAKQQAMLLDLISEWTGILNDNAATARMAELKADLNETWLAWSGPVTGEQGTNIAAYYRIQGPHLIIEYAPQNDEPTNHVHTIYRDPTNDYGRALAKK